MGPYWLFKVILFPFLPYLVYEASKIKKNGTHLPSLSEHVTLGKGEKKIIVLGESTVAGVGASSIEHTLAGNLSTLLGDGYVIENIGKNGLTVKNSITYLKNREKKPTAKITGFFLFLGANDCFRLTEPQVFQHKLLELISFISLEYSPSWIYLADIPPVHIFPAFPPLLRKFLNFQRLHLQSRMLRILKEKEKVIFDPINFQIELHFFSRDQIHPSDYGYKKMAEFACKKIEDCGYLQTETTKSKN